MKNWQEFKDKFCRKCMHYFYVGGKKIYQEQVRICQRPDGECKKLLNAVIKETMKNGKEV